MLPPLRLCVIVERKKLLSAVPDDQADVLPAAGELDGELRLDRPVVAERRQVLADEVDRAERGRRRVRVELEVVRRHRQHAVGERRRQRALGRRAAVAGVAQPLRAERRAVELVRAGLRAARAREDAEADALGLGGVVDLVGRAVVDVVDAGRVERDRGRVRRVGAAVDAVLDLVDAGARLVVRGGQRQRASSRRSSRAGPALPRRRGVDRRRGLVLILRTVNVAVLTAETLSLRSVARYSML